MAIGEAEAATEWEDGEGSKEGTPGPGCGSEDRLVGVGEGGENHSGDVVREARDEGFSVSGVWDYGFGGNRRGKRHGDATRKEEKEKEKTGGDLFVAEN